MVAKECDVTLSSTILLNFSRGEEATDEEMRIIFFGVSGLQELSCTGGEDLCLDHNLPRTQLRCDRPFNHFQSRRQCVQGAEHEILYVTKRL